MRTTSIGESMHASIKSSDTENIANRSIQMATIEMISKYDNKNKLLQKCNKK